MEQESSIPMKLILSRSAGSNRISVGLDSFLEFNAQMDLDLDALVDRWWDFTTPASLRRERMPAGRA